MKRVHILVFALLLIGAGKHQLPSTGVSLRASDWEVRYSVGVPSHPSALVGMTGWFLHIPSAPGSLNYVTTDFTALLHLGQAVTFTAQIVVLSGAPTFEPSEACGTPGATVRTYIEAKPPKGCPGAVYTCAPDSARWWANPNRVQLAPGLVTVSTIIAPDQWSDAGGKFGTDVSQGFLDAITHPAAVGLTFGSDCAFSHGVYAQGGSARFILTNYAVQ